MAAGTKVALTGVQMCSLPALPCASRENGKGKQTCCFQDGSVSASHEKLNTCDFGTCHIFDKSSCFSAVQVRLC